MNQATTLVEMFLHANVGFNMLCMAIIFKSLSFVMLLGNLVGHLVAGWFGSWLFNKNFFEIPVRKNTLKTKAAEKVGGQCFSLLFFHLFQRPLQHTKELEKQSTGSTNLIKNPNVLIPMKALG